MMKRCKKCNIDKSLDDFHKEKAGRYGRASACKQCKRKYQVEYLKKEEVVEKLSTYFRTEKQKEKARKYYQRNKEEVGRKVEKYRKENLDKYNKRNRDRYKEDPLFRVRGLLRNALRRVLDKTSSVKEDRLVEYCGASIEIVKEHIESTFVEGMSWSNHGEWHIDHIIPLAEASCVEDLYRLSHYSNLQALWKKDNLSKGKKRVASHGNSSYLYVSA